MSTDRLAKAYPCHEVKCHLSDGTPVLHNPVQGDSIEANGCLRPLTNAEALEAAQIVSDDDAAFADACKEEKESTLRIV